MKFYVFLIAALFASCAKQEKSNKQFLCSVPALGQVQVATNHPKVTEARDAIILALDEGDLVVPKSMCAELKIRKASN